MAKKTDKNNEYSIEPVSLLLDEPVGGIDEDILNLRPFAEVIAGAALGTKGPFTIGVYADWGEGKTSVLRLAKDLVEKNNKDIVTVWFNAWQYGKEDHPIIPLVSTIAKAVSDKLATVKGDKLKKGLRKMSSVLRAVAYGFSAKGKVGIPGFSELEAGFVAKEMIDRYDQLQKPDDPLIEKTLYYNAFESLEKLTKGDDADVKAPRIAVFIDDLDRCNPPEAVKLLESIKLVLSQKGFVFTLALDEQILRGFLKHRYTKVFKIAGYEAGGKDYLDKIIQLPLPLPPHKGRFDEYIDRLLKENPAFINGSNQLVKEVIAGGLKDVLSKGACFNPRNLVRFLNNLIVDKLLWDATMARKDNGVRADKKVMGLCVISRILRDHFKDNRLYNFLWNNQDCCNAVRSFIENKTAEPAKPEPKGGEDIGDRFIKPADKIIDKLRQMDTLQEVLRTEQGKEWLQNEELRKKVNAFIVEQREDEKEPQTDDEKVFDDEIRRILNIETGAISTKDYESIEELNLFNKGVKTLPEAIGKLAGLQRLSLAGNNLTTLPDAIGKLTDLKWLSLDDNQLTALPEAIGELAGLKVLDLSGNKFSEQEKNRIMGLVPHGCSVVL